MILGAERMREARAALPLYGGVKAARASRYEEVKEKDE